MVKPRTENSQNLNVVRVNVDISEKIKTELIEHKKKVFSGSTSAWLCTLLDGYLDNDGKTSFLTADLIARYESMADVKYNNLVFYITQDQTQKLDILCKKNMRNRKQQLALFSLNLYNALCVSK